MRIEVDNSHLDENLSVDLVDHDLLKGDLAVVNAARVSFAKAHDRFDRDKDTGLINFLARENHWSPFAHPQVCFLINMYPLQLQDFALRRPVGLRITERSDSLSQELPFSHLISGSLYGFLRNMDLFLLDQRVDIAAQLHRNFPVSYEALYNEPADNAGIEAAVGFNDLDLIEEFYGEGHAGNVRHHATATLKVTAPIIIARQLAKHQVDLVWNEISRRYVTDTPGMWQPKDGWRFRAENVKQGSSDMTLEGVPTYTVPLKPLGLDLPFKAEVQLTPEMFSDLAVGFYESMLDSQVAPEQARSILGQNMVTEWYWTGTVDAFARVCRERLHPTAQKESRRIAEQIEDVLAGEWGDLWYTTMAESDDE